MKESDKRDESQSMVERMKGWSIVLAAFILIGLLIYFEMK